MSWRRSCYRQALREVTNGTPWKGAQARREGPQLKAVDRRLQRLAFRQGSMRTGVTQRSSSANPCSGMAGPLGVWWHGWRCLITGSEHIQ